MKFKEFIGIDISKLTFDVRIHSNQKAIVFDNNTTGYAKMAKWIEKHTECSKGQILFGLEYTGIYSLPISSFFAENNYYFVLIPGLQIKRSLGIQRGKDDKIDAKRIAEYIHQKRDKITPSVLPSEDLLKMRRLLSIRERLVKQRAGYMKDKGENDRFLSRDENGTLFGVVDKVINEIGIHIEEVEKELDKIMNENELVKSQYKLITSIKGVGRQTALYTIIYTNCFTSFSDWRKFATYSGTAPFSYGSGTSVKGKSKVSHLANKKMKALLNMCARSAIVFNAEMKLYYKSRKEKGDNGMSIMNIIRNKLIARIFAVINRGTPYVDTLKCMS